MRPWALLSASAGLWLAAWASAGEAPAMGLETAIAAVREQPLGHQDLQRGAHGGVAGWVLHGSHRVPDTGSPQAVDHLHDLPLPPAQLVQR